MVKIIGILGDIGSGKSFVAKSIGYPVFNADHEVGKLYKKDKKDFKKLQKILPKYFNKFPIDKCGTDLKSAHERILVETHIKSPEIKIDNPSKI